LCQGLYGTLSAAYLFWRNLSEKLHKWRFLTNPYDSCVANRELFGSECAILWHVDDLKISHVNRGVVNRIVYILEE